MNSSGIEEGEETKDKSFQGYSGSTGYCGMTGYQDNTGCVGLTGYQGCYDPEQDEERQQRFLDEMKMVLENMPVFINRDLKFVPNEEILEMSGEI